jgi:hypothetical protein
LLQGVNNLLITGEVVMETQKSEVFQEMGERGVTLAEAAEKMGFDPALLKLYFADDAYPVPQRIIDKLAAAINN